MELDWKVLLKDIDDFFYSENGLMTTAYVDESLKSYFWDMDKIVQILKRIKSFDNNLLSNEQLEQLNDRKEELLSLDNGRNGIKDFYYEILRIYQNIDNY